MTGKYGITQHLPAAATDVAQRFHVAMLRRMYAVQLGATPALDDPLDAAIALMHQWAARPAAGAPRLALVATGHVYLGLCPDDAQPGARDPQCQACALLPP